MDSVLSLLSDHTVRLVTLGALVLGLVSGALGSFAILRRQSLLGDAISHATLPGVALAFLLTQSKHPLVLLFGAALAGWIGTLMVMLITNTTRIKKDAALGIVLSVFFGFGLMLLTIIQRLPTASKAGLDNFLFGSAATILKADLWVMIILGLIVLSILVLLWKEFKLLTFDEDFAKSMGLSVRPIDVLLTSLIVVAIVLGLQMVGVVLMSAMLVAPAAAARQWTDRLSVMVILSAILGAIAGVAGALTSSIISKLPTGPTIVVYVSVFVFVSLLLAPNRGLVWDWMRSIRHRHTMRLSTMLQNLMLFSEIQSDPFHPHDIAALRVIGRAAADKTMNEMQKKGWVKQFQDRRWALTEKGLEEAKRLEKEIIPK